MTQSITVHLLDGVPTVIPENLGYRHQYVLLTLTHTNYSSAFDIYVCDVQCQRILAIPGTAYVVFPSLKMRFRLTSEMVQRACPRFVGARDKKIRNVATPYVTFTHIVTTNLH